jgi:3-hydroxybutyryl-CoA dehydrogenase
VEAVGIIGAGTMGAGIAQVASVHGWEARLLDVDRNVVATAIDGVHKRLNRLVEKGKLTDAQRTEAAARLKSAATPDDLHGCALVIEAVVEDFDVKVKVLQSAPKDAIVATNTSALSISRLGDALGDPSRVVGMHFFNPAPLMRLVEVVAGAQTDPTVVDRVADIATAWNKKVARAADVPGFIVNHVARPYYLEAFRILEDGWVGAERIDQVMRQYGGFRMGPLELTDLIGQDVNTATTQSVWTQLDHPPLLHPSRLQEQLVADGNLGRKTGRGVYDYSGASPAAVLTVDQRTLELSDDLSELVMSFASASGATDADPSSAYVLARIGAALIVQAHAAHTRGVASKADIDIAMRYGVNYPRGPFQWFDLAGDDLCRRLVVALNAQIGSDRFVFPDRPAKV